MAQMIPMLTDSQVAAFRSRAEGAVYRACRDQLPDSWLVRHSLSMVRRDPSGRLTDGEADFVVVLDAGIIVLEVKGGRVCFDATTGVWSTSPLGTGDYEPKISNPFVQAVDRKKDLERALEFHPKGKGRRPPSAHGVLLPDVSEAEAAGCAGLHATPAMIGGVDAVRDLKSWLETLMLDAWGSPSPAPLDEVEQGILRELLGKSFTATPLISRALEALEAERLLLTFEQGILLEALSLRNRALIAGGAGTGKTVLAVEWARRLAAEGSATLLLCFNLPLADHLRGVCAKSGDKYQPMTFHALCKWRVEEVKKKTGVDLLAEARMALPSGDLFENWFPYALARSVQCDPLRYDAIIVDEAQDFSIVYWASVKALLRDRRKSMFYLFYDTNQRVYDRGMDAALSEPPFLLTRNCRNTDHIHKHAYHHYSGAPMRPPPIPGFPIRVLSAPGQLAQAALLRDEVARLISEEGVRPEDIAVLVSSETPTKWFDAIESTPKLPNRVKWSPGKHWQGGKVLLDSVRRFKGLESPIVVLWLSGVESITTEVVYVGMTRAKSLLVLVGSDEACQLALGRPEDPDGL